VHISLKVTTGTQRSLARFGRGAVGYVETKAHEPSLQVVVCSDGRCRGQTVQSLSFAAQRKEAAKADADAFFSGGAEATWWNG